jgi:hypothetical protein
VRSTAYLPTAQNVYFVRFPPQECRLMEEPFRVLPVVAQLRNCRDPSFRLYCGRQVISTRTGISFLTGIVSSDGGSILKSVSVAGIVPVM